MSFTLNRSTCESFEAIFLRLCLRSSKQKCLVYSQKMVSLVQADACVGCESQQRQQRRGNRISSSNSSSNSGGGGGGSKRRRRGGRGAAAAASARTTHQLKSQLRSACTTVAIITAFGFQLLSIRPLAPGPLFELVSSTVVTRQASARPPCIPPPPPPPPSHTI